MSCAMTTTGTGAARGGPPPRPADTALPPRSNEADAASDARALALARNGDRAAFGLLVERYQRPMAALITRVIAPCSADDVDDMLQELFVRAWKGLPRFRGDAQFSTWLYRIAVNTALKHRTRRNGTGTMHWVSLDDTENNAAERSLAAPADGAAHEGGDPYLLAARQAREAQIRSAVEALPPKQRVVIVLHYYEGHSCEEIAEIVDCSVGTVWSRLHYACKRLKGPLGSAIG